MTPVKLLTIDEVAELVRRPVSWLRRGKGPKPLRYGGRKMLYHPADVARWQNACRPISSENDLAGLGGSDSSTAATSTEAALRQQIEDSLNAKLARSEQRSKRPRLARTKDGAA